MLHPWFSGFHPIHYISFRSVSGGRRDVIFIMESFGTKPQTIESNDTLLRKVSHQFISFSKRWLICVFWENRRRKLRQITPIVTTTKRHAQETFSIEVFVRNKIQKCENEIFLIVWIKCDKSLALLSQVWIVLLSLFLGYFNGELLEDESWLNRVVTNHM